MEDDSLLSGKILFEVPTPLGFAVRTTVSYWTLISTTKHPGMRDRLEDVRKTLSGPDEVRGSKTDAQVYLFYRGDGQSRWVCAVTKQIDNVSGFLITAYRTSAVKEGEVLWQK